VIYSVGLSDFAGVMRDFAEGRHRFHSLVHSFRSLIPLTISFMSLAQPLMSLVLHKKWRWVSYIQGKTNEIIERMA
jgi:hypothetical protein